MKLFSPAKVAVLAAATFFFVATAARGQCYTVPIYDPYYSAPIYTAPIYSSPRTTLADPEYHNIHYSGTVRTKEYVAACLPHGKRITIPVINGIAPLINRSYSGNSVVYDLDYDSGSKWSGKTPINYSDEKKQPPRVTETVETVSFYDYKGKKIGVSEWTDRPPVITENRTPAPKVGEETYPATRVPAPSFQDEMKKLQELYEQRQKAKEEEYAASQKLKDQQYLDTIQQLRASVAELKESVAELKEMVQKMEKPPAAVPPKLEEAPMPRLSPGMKKPSEIVPKGS